MTIPKTRESGWREDETLANAFEQIGRGIYPPCDGLTEVVPCPSNVPAAVFAFTGHHIVAADIDSDWVEQRRPPNDLPAPISPSFLLALGDRLGCRPTSLCLVLYASGLAGAPEVDLVPVEPTQLPPHVARAHRYRRDARVYQTVAGDGLLTLGRGIAGRWEAGFKVRNDGRSHGLGRTLAATALHLIEPDAPVFTQVAIGNIASIRTILAAGFVPIGAEVLSKSMTLSRTTHIPGSARRGNAP